MGQNLVRPPLTQGQIHIDATEEKFGDGKNDRVESCTSKLLTSSFSFSEEEWVDWNLGGSEHSFSLDLQLSQKGAFSFT